MMKTSIKIPKTEFFWDVKSMIHKVLFYKRLYDPNRNIFSRAV